MTRLLVGTALCALCALALVGSSTLAGAASRNTSGAALSHFAKTSVERSSSGDAYVKAIAAGGLNTCALLSNGRVKCWGQDFISPKCRPKIGCYQEMSVIKRPMLVRKIKGAISISAKGSLSYQHTCVLLSTRVIKCWGDNYAGELGNRARRLIGSDAPTKVIGISNAVAVSAGYYHTCAILVTNRVKCWGDYQYGQLGDGKMATGRFYQFPGGDEFTRSTPVYAKGIKASAISAGELETCAIPTGSPGAIECWGALAVSSKTGVNGSTIPIVYSTPTALQVPTQPVSTSADPPCAVLSDGRLMCWEKGPTKQPKEFAGIDNAVAVSSGPFSSCVLLFDGTIKCWGESYEGELGNGTKGNKVVLVPVKVKGINDAVSVSVGYWHACALLSSGTVKCWGYGPLGNGKTRSSRVPVTVVGLPTGKLFPPENTALPVITGTTVEGQTLTVSDGSWSNSPLSLSYQWQYCNSAGINCSNINYENSTSSTYVLQPADVGRTFRVVVIASNSYGKARAISTQTAVVTSS